MLNRRSFMASAAAVGVSTFGWRSVAAQPGRSEVHVGATEDPQTLDPANHRSRTTENVIRNIHDGVLTRDPDMKVVSEIASAWRPIDDKTWEFDIRQGIKFHSGDMLTADDIVFTFNRLVHEGAMEGQTSPRKGILARLADTVKVDDFKVRMILSDPWAYLPDYLPVQEVVNKRHVERVGHEALQTQTDGCGPFMLSEWRRGEAVIMDRFPEYYGGSPEIPPVGPALVDRIVFRTIPDASARLAGLLSGELDIVTNLLPTHVSAIEGNPRAEVMSVVGTTHFYVGVNVNKGFLGDVRVRRALSLAIDRNQIIERVMNGNASPLRGVMAPEDAGYNPNLPELAYDLEQAKALLEQAGVPAGTELIIDTIDANKEIAEVIASLLSRTGLRVRPQVWEGSVLSPTWRDDSTRADRDLILNSMGNSAMTAELLTSALKTGGGLNIVGYSDPEMDRMLEEFDSAPVDQRDELGFRIQEKAAADIPQIFLWVPTDLYGVSKRITGWKPRSDSRINLHRVKIVG